MPLQNRVTPFGEIVAIAERGAMMGNRGIIHDASTRTLLSRRWQHQAWICCVLDFRGYQHPIMGRGRYTELFFLDEATAFAAGHRPCAYCRRTDFNAFKHAWANAFGVSPGDVRAPAMDRRLHRERTTRGRAKVTYTTALDGLPDDVMIKLHDQAWLVRGRRLLRWQARGYESAQPRPRGIPVEVLTPRAIVAVFTHGYQAKVHPSAAGSR